MEGSLKSLANSFKKFFGGRKAKAQNNTVEMNQPVKENIKRERINISDRDKRILAYKKIQKRTAEKKIANRRRRRVLGNVTHNMNFAKAA